MSDTTVIGVADGVAAYVSEVRAELADLPAEDVDDLTGGMEADLSELATESGGDLIGRLGTPGLYAAELRAAAGLPDRAVGSGGRQHRPLREQVALDRASFNETRWTAPMAAVGHGLHGDASPCLVAAAGLPGSLGSVVDAQWQHARRPTAFVPASGHGDRSHRRQCSAGPRLAEAPGRDLPAARPGQFRPGRDSPRGLGID